MRFILPLAFIATCSVTAQAQDLVGFDLSDFGKIVLSHPEFAGDAIPEAAFGNYNNEPISKYPNSIFAQLGRAVGRLDVATDAGVFPCTAFLVADDLVMTNHHCVPGILDHPRVDANAIVGVRFTTGYVIEGVEEGAASFLVNLNPVETNKDLDYTLLRVLGAKPGQEFGTLRLASTAPVEHAPYWIIGHPNGDAQRISREGCAAADPALSRNRLRHNCDTLPGNSGSPVIDAGTQQVVALHNAGSSAKQVNYAVPMSMILDHSAILKPHTDAVAKPDPEVVALTQLGRALAFQVIEDKRKALEALIADHPNTSAAATAQSIIASLAQPVNVQPAVPPQRPPAPQLSLQDRMAADPNVQDCDRLAGSPSHPDIAKGHMTQTGREFSKIDTGRAIPVCQTALEAFPDHPRLTSSLGRAYDAAERYDEAIHTYEKAAGAGDVIAQFNLGWMYGNGRGVAQSDARAVEWYRKAAEQGDAVAQSNLGWMYGHGRGVAQSDTSAVEWYRKAAEQGEATAQINLGLMFELGRGVSTSPTKAVDLYVAALEGGRTWAIDRNSADWDPATAKQLQRVLKQRGLYSGPIDGDIRPETKAAMRKLLPE